jgi:hypothetical protein
MRHHRATGGRGQGWPLKRIDTNESRMGGGGRRQSDLLDYLIMVPTSCTYTSYSRSVIHLCTLWCTLRRRQIIRIRKIWCIIRNKQERVWEEEVQAWFKKQSRHFLQRQVETTKKFVLGWPISGQILKPGTSRRRRNANHSKWRSVIPVSIRILPFYSYIIIVIMKELNIKYSTPITWKIWRLLCVS